MRSFEIGIIPSPSSELLTVTTCPTDNLKDFSSSRTLTFGPARSAKIEGRVLLLESEIDLIKSKSIEGAKEQQKILGGQLSKSINKINLFIWDYKK